MNIEKTIKTDLWFLSGGGEMGQLIREKDWSKTSLGAPETWPRSLRTMVAVMLDNPFGMYIAWGNDYTQLYNDGYRPILGATKHPQALGISTSETFSEIWHIIESMFDGVLKGTAVGFPDLMLPLNRNGFIEECYFDFAYSPIRKDDGEVGGVLVTVIETTDKKKAQSQLEESTNQLKFAIDAAELGTWDYNPATNKFTANSRLKTWFGIAGSEDIELSHATNAIAEKDKNRVINAIKKVLDYSSGGIYDEEYSIINPLTKEEIIVHGKGRAWFNDEKIAYRFNGILQEVTENALARKRIDDSADQLRIAIEGGEFGTFDFIPETKQLIWSAKTKELFGLPADASVDYETYIAAIHPEDTGISTAIAQQQADLKVDGLYELEYRTIGITDGKLRWLRSKGKATYNKNGQPIRYTGVIQDITTQKESEEKVRESNQRFRNTMKQAPVGITILRGPEYIVEMANDAYLQLVDKKESEFVGNSLFTSLPEVEDAVHALLDNVLKTGIPYHGNEVPIPVNRYGKKNVFYFDFLYHPLKEVDGKISGVIAIVTEVTEKVESRNIIEERKRLYETITQNTPDLIYVFDLNYRFTYANDALLKMWGRTWDDAVGKSMLENGYERWHAEMHEREIDQVIATKKPVRGEVFFPHASLGKRMYDYIFAPVINEKGEVEAITGTTRDISDIKNAEEELKKSEEQFRLLSDSMPQQIWTSDPEGNFNYFNKSVFNYSGLTLEQINKDGWLQIVHPDDKDENIKAWTDSVSTGKDFLFEHRFRRYDGEYRWQLSRAVPQRDEAGNIQMWVGTSTDIHDKKVTEVQLDKLVKERTIQLERSNEDLQQFAHVASHDLKEPLRKIKIFTNRAKEEYLNSLPDPVVNFLEKITDASTRMQMMVDGVLSFSSVNSTEQPIEKIDLNDTFNNLKNDLEILIEQKKAKIICGDLPTIEGGAILINQLFYNLLHNSLKFSKGSEAPLIEISSTPVNEGGIDLAKILIKDNGIGFNQSNSEQIFETFVRLNSKDKYEGTGLGLSLCKKIVERHNGIIEAKSKEKEGTTFIVTLPLKQMQNHM